MNKIWLFAHTVLALLTSCDASAFQIGSAYVASESAQVDTWKPSASDVNDICTDALKAIQWHLQANGYKVEGQHFYSPEGDIFKVSCVDGAVRVTKLGNKSD